MHLFSLCNNVYCIMNRTRKYKIAYKSATPHHIHFVGLVLKLGRFHKVISLHGWSIERYHTCARRFSYYMVVGQPICPKYVQSQRSRIPFKQFNLCTNSPHKIAISKKSLSLQFVSSWSPGESSLSK